MRTILLFAALGFGVAAAPPPDKAVCDAKPFTLNKPVPKAQKPKLAEATPAKPPKAKPTPKPKTRAELIGDCKGSKPKKPN